MAAAAPGEQAALGTPDPAPRDVPSGPRGPGPRRPLLALTAGVALLAAGVGALLVSTAGSPPHAEPVGGNLPVNAGATDPRDLAGHNSPVLVRNPEDPAELVVASRIDNPRFSCALHTSTDGGASFTEAALPDPDPQGACYAPDVAFGADGTLHVVWVTLRGRGNRPHRAWHATSDDGGRTFADAEQLLGPLAFQVGLATDPDRPGHLYVTWLQADETATLGFPDTGYPIRFMASDDAGRSWSQPVTVSGAERARVLAPTLAVGSDGVLHLAYLDLGEDRLDWSGAHEGRGGPAYPGTWELVAARSGDGGATWSETTVDTLRPAERVLVFLPPVPALAVDRDAGRVYAAFHARHEGDADVFVWRSTDTGAAWSAPVRVHDTPPADGSTQYLPALDVAPSGRVDVVAYDRRDDPGDVMNEVVLSSSHDGGVTFGEGLVASDVAFDSRVGFGSFRGMADLGSRLGLVSTDERALAVWTDTRSGTEASGKQDLVRQTVVFRGGPAVAGAARTGLRAGGVLAVAFGSLLLLHVLRGRARRPHRPDGTPPMLTLD